MGIIAETDLHTTMLFGIECVKIFSKKEKGAR